MVRGLFHNPPPSLSPVRVINGPKRILPTESVYPKLQTFAGVAGRSHWCHKSGHSTTSSARSRTEGGMTRHSDLAVARLTIISNTETTCGFASRKGNR